MSEKERAIVTIALDSLKHYSPSVARHYAIAFEELDKQHDLKYEGLEKKMKELIDNTSPEDLAKKMMSYGMKFKNPPV